MSKAMRAVLALLVAVCAVGALSACGGDYAGKQDVANVQAAVDELAGTLAQLKSDVDALKGAGDSGIAGRVQQLETKLTAAQTALTAMQEAMKELDGAPESLAALNTAVKEIQTSLSALTGNVDDLDAALTTVNEALTAMREQLDALAGKTENDGSKVKAIGEPTNVYSNGLLIFTITPTQVAPEVGVATDTYIYYTIESAIGIKITKNNLAGYIYNQQTKSYIEGVAGVVAFDFAQVTATDILDYQFFITYNNIPIAQYNLALPPVIN